MSRAIQCDRCSKCFAPSDLDETFYLTIKDIYAQSGNDYKNHVVDKMILNKTWPDRGDELNFCPECTQAFYRFMDHV